jgi:hypothetical protein
MSARKTIWGSQSGAAALEFAIAAPIVLMLIFGLIEFSTILYARAGLQEAVEAGARYATIYPTPSDAQIIAKINSAKFGLQASRVTGPSFNPGTTLSGVRYVDITMSYSVPLHFAFVYGPSITLTRTSRAYKP